MQMHDLNNTQLILLALLVSFVTSIATGIVTVTLLDQAPPAVTQTINRVIEKTVEVVAPAKTQSANVTQTIIVKEEEFITKAAEKNAAYVVEVGRLKKHFSAGGIGRPLKEELSFEAVGTAFLLSDEFVVSYNPAFGKEDDIALKTQRGAVYRITATAQSLPYNLALFAVNAPVKELESEDGEFAMTPGVSPITFADPESIKIGQTTIALGVNNGVSLSLGVISQLDTAPAISFPEKKEGEETKKEITVIYTTGTLYRQYSGGPLININGEVLGVNAVTGEGGSFAIPAQSIKISIEHITSKKSQ